jgi:hypothetical protein
VSSTTDMLAKNVKRDPASIQIPFRYSEGADGGTRTLTGFPTTPSRCRSLAVTGARASFPIQHPSRPAGLFQEEADLAVHNVGGHPTHELHNYFTID